MLTEKQRANRKNGIGGSDASAVLNIKPLDPRKKQFKTPLQLWLEKTGRIEPEDLSRIEPIIWGNLLEDDVIERYVMKTGHKVKLLGRTLKHKKYPWMFANLDGLVIKEGILIEAKTAEYSKEWGKDGTSNVPLEYLVQVQHCLEVLSSHEKYKHITEARIPTFFSRKDFRTFNISRDNAITEHLIEAERAFWHDNVLADIPPQPNNRDDTVFLFPNDDGSIIESDTIEAEKEFNKYKKVREELKMLEREKEEIEAKITSRIGAASGLRVKNDLITWKKYKSTRVLRLYERE